MHLHGWCFIYKNYICKSIMPLLVRKPPISSLRLFKYFLCCWCNFSPFSLFLYLMGFITSWSWGEFSNATAIKFIRFSFWLSKISVKVQLWQLGFKLWAQFILANFEKNYIIRNFCRSYNSVVKVIPITFLIRYLSTFLQLRKT